MKRDSVLVIGTGTIGEPLIGLLADFKKKLGLSEIMFHKRTPLRDEVAKVQSLVKRGARLVINQDKVEDFKALGHKPKYTSFDKALDKAHVVIDCTPVGNHNKEKHFLSYSDKTYGHIGTVYKASNFKKDKDVKPSYHYEAQEGHRYHKKTIWDRSKKFKMSEKEYALKHNLERVEHDSKSSWVRYIKGR